MPSKLFQFAKKAILPVGAVTASVTAYLIYDDYKSDHRYNKPHETVIPAPTPPPRSRSDILRSMAETAEYDMLVIGGGATGAGVAWDAVTRGYKTALVERDDFASATSSRSTKLVHGGVRYLEKAFWHADYNQYLLVKEALAERRRFIDMAPHLSFPLPIMIPVYKWWQLPYYYVGVKMYDLIAGKANLEPSYLVTRTRALRLFPMLNESELKGAIIYYDGSQNDARMNASLAVTAIEKGADILNYTEVVGLAKDAKGKVCGAEVVDRETNEKFTIRAKSVINATGPFTDAIRKMDDAKTPDIAIGSSGVHIILPGWYCPSNIGLLDAATSDGRVVFFLPWQGSTIAGTTDRPSEIEANPTPTEEDINFVLNEVKHYIDGKLDVKRGDVRAAWSGIRPLVRDPETTDTSNVVRSHSVMVSPSNLVTIAGGKWTTFREMAEETVDKAADVAGLPKLPCRTRDHGEKLVGAEGWDQLRYVDLIRDFGIEPAAARHLSENYGMRAFDVARLCTPTALTPEGTVVQRNARLSPLYPFLDGEILYAMGYEYARTPIDILARRTRLAFLDAEAARDALPDIIEIMARHLGWSLERQGQEFTQSMQWLQAMGLQTYKQAPLSEAITVTPTQHTVEPTDPGNVDPEQLTQAVRALPDMTAQAVSQSLSEQEQLSSLVPLQKEHAHLARPTETAAEKPAEQAQQTQQAPPPAPKNPAAKAAAEKTTH